MTAGIEFLLGLLTRQHPAHAAYEDFTGPHGGMLRQLQRRSFVASEPGVHPSPSCPHCGEGVPYRLQGQVLCNRCGSSVDDRHSLLWRLDLEAFLGWLAAELKLRGSVRSFDGRLWQLGTWESEEGILECFYRRDGSLSDLGRRRLTTYRNVLVLYGLTVPTETERFAHRRASLLELLQFDNALGVRDLGRLLGARGRVRFDVHSGTLLVGDAPLGDVPVGCKEYYFLAYLAAHLDQYVAYADLKHFVLREAGSTDTTEEATFCQGLKSRIKKKWIPQIDRLIVTTNKGDGYRLRAFAQAC